MREFFYDFSLLIICLWLSDINFFYFQERNALGLGMKAPCFLEWNSQPQKFFLRSKLACWLQKHFFWKELTTETFIFERKAQANENWCLKLPSACPRQILHGHPLGRQPTDNFKSWPLFFRWKNSSLSFFNLPFDLLIEPFLILLTYFICNLISPYSHEEKERFLGWPKFGSKATSLKWEVQPNLHLYLENQCPYFPFWLYFLFLPMAGKKVLKIESTFFQESLILLKIWRKRKIQLIKKCVIQSSLLETNFQIVNSF